MALYRNWEIFVDHQAIGNECYLGIAHLAAIAGRAMRTMEKNLAALSVKQLLVERAERKVLCGSDGSLKSKVVVIKDFSGLYALAHEYHEWLSDDNYIDSDREVVELVALPPDLVAKLSRFDNYRRVLYNRLPGPQPRVREEDRWFHEEHFVHPEVTQVEDAKKQETGILPNKYLPNELANPVA